MFLVPRVAWLPSPSPDQCHYTAYREIVLGRLSALVKKFVHRVSLSRGLSEAAASAAGGNIYTFGSYRLGVHGSGADIDTLCVAPRQVTREDFFSVLEDMLREMEGVTEVSVRVMKFHEHPVPISSRVSSRGFRMRTCLSSRQKFREFRSISCLPNCQWPQSLRT